MRLTGVCYLLKLLYNLPLFTNVVLLKQYGDSHNKGAFSLCRLRLLLSVNLSNSPKDLVLASSNEI